MNRHLSQVLTLNYLASAALSTTHDRVLLLLLVHVFLRLLVLLVVESGRLIMMLIILKLLTFVKEVTMTTIKFLLLKHQFLPLILHPELPVALLYLLADLVNAWVESALFRLLVQLFPLLG